MIQATARRHHGAGAVHHRRIMDALSTVTSADRMAQLAVTAWLRFVTIAILDWLDEPAITRDQLRDMCTRALLAAVKLPRDVASL